ncbi:MAG: hypothetical protein Crog4KO_02810 [Crocinitomicaceae bacterium]
MLQRPQSLLFLAAAIVAFVASFSPLATYSPEKNSDYPELEKLDFRMHVNTNAMDFDMKFVPEFHGSKKTFKRNMIQGQEEMDKEMEARGISIIFTIGMAGTLLLGAIILILIFLYNNRKVQIRMGIALFLLTLTATAGIFLGSKFALEIFSSLDIVPSSLTSIEWVVSYNYGIFLFPLIAVLLLIGVLLTRKDDNLVKSLDRLR